MRMRLRRENPLNDDVSEVVVCTHFSVGRWWPSCSISRSFTLVCSHSTALLHWMSMRPWTKPLRSHSKVWLRTPVTIFSVSCPVGVSFPQCFNLFQTDFFSRCGCVRVAFSASSLAEAGHGNNFFDGCQVNGYSKMADQAYW